MTGTKMEENNIVVYIIDPKKGTECNKVNVKQQAAEICLHN